jgi:hypothetical protein
VSGMRKAVAGLAGLVLVGGACLLGMATAPVAGAASPACGRGCSSLYNQKFGTADVSAVSSKGSTIPLGFLAVPNEAVKLDAAASSTTEDWQVAFEGTVNDWFGVGLINATLDQPYGTDETFEFEYTPGGVSTGLCLGIASPPAQGTKVTLQACGVTVRTIWISDAADANGGYAPYVNGAGTQYPAPFVLTAPKAGGPLTTRALKANKKGVIHKAQMWQLISGVLS